MFLFLLLFAWTVKTTDNPNPLLCVWPFESEIWTHNPHAIQDSHHTTCVAIFRVFLGKHVKGRFPLQKFIRPSLCPNPNP